jgi:branched-chain amino acid aminotransferase
VNGSFGGHVDPADRGFTLGDGVFDTLTAFNRIPFAGERHLTRLTEQASAIGIEIDGNRVREAWDAVLAYGESEHLILRTTVTRGAAGRGLWPTSTRKPSLIVTATPWNRDLLGKEVRLITSSIKRNPASPSSRLKTLGYLDHVLAAREAASRNVEDALLLNVAGRVACTTIANVFAISGDRLLTPPPAEGVMPGIMRALVLEAASAAGLDSEERALAVEELTQADVVFLTNSVRFLSPVLSVDGITLSRRGGVSEAELGKSLATKVRDACGFELLPSP